MSKLHRYVATLSYRELQTELRNYRASGHDVQVRLNAKREVLESEFIRLELNYCPEIWQDCQYDEVGVTDESLAKEIQADAEMVAEFNQELDIESEVEFDTDWHNEQLEKLDELADEVKTLKSKYEDEPTESDSEPVQFDSTLAMEFVVAQGIESNYEYIAYMSQVTAEHIARTGKIPSEEYSNDYTQLFEKYLPTAFDSEDVDYIDYLIQVACQHCIRKLA